MPRSVLIFALLLITSLPARAEVLVFAAASLKEPVDQMAAQFDNVVVSYGGSGTLARQVTLGAPADIVLLANVAWMDELARSDAVKAESIADFASNRLVVVGQAGQAPLDLTPDAIRARLNDGRLAIGLTTAVPAGIYGKAALQSLDLWDDLEGSLAQTDSVRAALALVARGQTPLGIVYQTDVRVVQELATLAIFPQTSHPTIRYVGAQTVSADQDAAAFWDFLQGEQGQAILARSGFLPAVDAGDG